MMILIGNGHDRETTHTETDHAREMILSHILLSAQKNWKYRKLSKTPIRQSVNVQDLGMILNRITMTLTESHLVGHTREIRLHED